MWANAIGHLALSANVRPSVSTSVSISVQRTSAGTLCCEPLHQSPHFPHGPIHDSHRHLRRHLRQLWHIHFHLVQLLHRVHPLCRALLLKWLLPALHQSRRLNLVSRALHIHSHQRDIRLLMSVVPMVLTPTLIGKKTEITMTTRRSTG